MTRKFSFRVLVLFGFLLSVTTAGFAAPPSSQAAEVKKSVKKEVATEYSPKYLSPLSKMELNDGDTIVFFGDSITHQCLYTQYFENYIYTRFPGKKIRMHNAGVSGARAWDALQRFDRDVAAYKPKYVTILLGMNDARYKPFDKDHFKTYQQDMGEIVKKIQAIGATPILMSPTMWDARARKMYPRKNRKEGEDMRKTYNGVLALYGGWLQEVATEKGLGYVDMFAPLNQLTFEARKKNPQFSMIKDAIHPDKPGQVVMATAMVADLGLPKVVSNIRLSHSEKKGFQAKAFGGKISEIKTNSDGIAFDWTANSLPWVFLDDAQLGVKITHLGHRHSREALEVHGLKEGHYQLTINDVVVGVYPSQKLERHIELQSNSKTPQYQRALAIAKLNKKRNETSVRKLRGEWSVYQSYQRMAVDKKPEDPSGAEFKIFEKRFNNLGKRLVGREERIKKYEADANAIELEIFKLSTPQVMHYQLKKVAAPMRAKRRKPAHKKGHVKQVPTTKN